MSTEKTESTPKSFDNLFIAISGIIGAGKTTLATALGEKMKLPVYYEPVIDNAYLADFYSDMARYSFPLQIYLLNNRFHQHQQIVWSGEGGVADRSIYEDMIFAKILRNDGLMEEREFATYESLFQNMANFMKKPNLIIHLDVTPEESFERIKKRGRDMESGISLDYLTKLHEGYNEFLDDISRYIPVIKVAWHEFADPEDMAAMVIREYSSMRSIRSVDLHGNPYQSPKRAARENPVSADNSPDEVKVV